MKQERSKQVASPIANRLPIFLSPSGIKKFLSQVDSSGGPDSCWPWTGLMYAVGSSEYGDAGITAAHRVAFWVEHRRQPRGDVVRHSCDNPPCCNPKHLLEGSYKDNHDDAKARGRAKGRPKGKKFRSLSLEEQLQIAGDKRRAVVVAAAHSISISHVHYLRRKHGKSRKTTHRYRDMIAAYLPPVSDE